MNDKKLEVKGVVQNKVRSRSQKLLSKHKDLPAVIEAMLLQIASIDSQIENSTNRTNALKGWRTKERVLLNLAIAIGGHKTDLNNLGEGK